jgi:hypothetical protein
MERPMRVAVMIIALCLVMVIGLQSCVAGVASIFLEDEATGDAALFGVFLAFFFVVGAALVWGFPRASAVIFLLSGGLAIALSTNGEFTDLAIWGGVSIVLGLMSFAGHRELRRAIAPATPMAPAVPTPTSAGELSAVPAEPDHLGVVIAAFVSIGLVAFIFSRVEWPEQFQQAVTEEAAAPVAEPPIAVSAYDLAVAYAENEVAAQLKYGNQTLEVTGDVDSVTLDASEQPVLVLSTGNPLFDILHSVRAQFDSGWSPQLAAMSRDDRVTIRCTKVSGVKGSAFLNHCVVPEQATVEAGNAEFDAAEPTDEADAQMAAQLLLNDAADAPPTEAPQITASWLVGTWGPVPQDPSQKELGGCDTDNVVTFHATGEYRDGGSYGRFKTDGVRITYYNRILYDPADDSRDTSQYGVPNIAFVSALGANSLREDGAVLYRCQG